MWKLVTVLPAVWSLYQQSRTAGNDMAAWGGIAVEGLALLARLYGVDVPAVIDMGAALSVGAGVGNKVGRESERKRMSVEDSTNLRP